MGKHNNNEKKENKVSLFEKIFATAIGIVILTVIIISLLTSEPKFAITPITIALFVLLIVVAGMFVFDYINVGNVISLKKENEEIREENHQFRIMAFNKNIMSSQNNFNVNINKAEDKDIAEKEKYEENKTQEEKKINRRLLTFEERKMVKEKALEKFCKERNVMSTIEPDRSFSRNISQINHIMSWSIVFDAYYQEQEKEYFLDTIVSVSSFNAYRYSLYMELSQIYHYRVKTGKFAKLILFLPLLKLENEELFKQREKSIEELKRLFSPAIENGLLEVVPIDMTEIAI